ncbi:MAG: LLM class flavin-dependent oxidoreductase [Bacteroidota bacterium]
MTSQHISNIPFSVLDLAMVIDGNSISESFANSIDLARHTEKFGYNRYWLAEHHNMESVASSATVVLIGHIASKTTTLRVGSGGIMLPNHAPLIVAEQFGTLETLYPNRIDMGLGRAPGTDQVTAYALRRDQKAAMEFPENIEELQTYLSSSNKNSRVRAIPGEGLNIPIWILGSSTDSAYVAAALGLPYAFASHFAPAHLHQALGIYRNNFKPSAQLNKPYTLACVGAIAADTNEEAENLATSFKKLYLGIITGKREKLKPAVKSSDFYLDPLEEQALQQMIKYSFVGNADRVKTQMQQFLDQTQVDELMITSAVYDHAARLHSYEIISKFKNQ